MYLIDSPGFDDSHRSDNEVLNALAAWITAAFANGIRLHCILYLHRITDYRVAGTGMRNLQMFKGMCGEEGHSVWRKVIFVTTMWEDLREEVGKEREKQLKRDPNYWEPMIKAGSRMERHERDDAVSARSIIDIAVEIGRDAELLEVPVALQMEYTSENRRLVETGAAQATLHHREEQRERLTRKNAALENAIQRAREAGDTGQQMRLEADMASNDRKLQALRSETEDLNITPEELLDNQFDDGPSQDEEKKEERVQHAYPKPGSYSKFTRGRAPLRWLSSSTTERPGNPPNTRRDPISLSLRGRHGSFIGPGITRTYVSLQTWSNHYES